jgi:acyl-coenzyme A synthetase/AMP-(fatty) acid ligase
VTRFLDLSTLRTVSDAFTIMADRHPSKECIRLPAMINRAYDPDGLSWSYGEVADKVERLRQTYREAGYGHGHRIALLLDNRPSIVAHWLAFNALGVSLVAVNQDSTAYEIAGLLARSHAVLVVALPAREPLIRQALALLEEPVSYCADEWPNALPPARVPAPHGTRPGRLSETALLFTSGTAGLPKGAILTNESMLFNAERYIAAGGLMTITYGEERLYNPLPIAYANALAHTNIVMVLSAGCMIFSDRFHASTWWKDILATDATIVHYLGIMAPALLARAPEPEERAHRVKFGLGSGVDANQHVEWERRFGFPLVEVYGMTELGICSFASHEPRLVGQHYVGQPIGGAEYRIVDEEGRDAEVGEGLVRRVGPDPRRGFFAGYLDDQDLTEHMWRGGWYHTGDVFRRDEAGRFFFVDRLKHMIRRSGQNISAGEVENCLRLHPAVAEVACVPVPDPLRQEEVMACVILKDGVSPTLATAESIFAFALERLAYFKVPGGVAFMRELPITRTNKLQKDRIFEKGEDPFRRPGTFDLRDRKSPARRNAVVKAEERAPLLSPGTRRQ